MNATARFYSVFVLALALVVGVSFFIGYKVGYHRGAAAHGVHRAIAPHATP